MTTADTLRDLRKKKGATQEDVAASVNIALTSYARYETGKRNPTTDIARRLADYFGVSIDTLITGESDAADRSRVLFGQTLSRSRYEDLTPEELEELDRYADYIRSRRSAKKRPASPAS